MIKDGEIEALAKSFALTPHNLQKDYVHGAVLFGISQRPYLRDIMLLKGGNALRKAYLPSTRYSKDLDFSLRGEAVWDLLEEELRLACGIASRATGVKFTRGVAMKRKKFDIPISALEAKLCFETFYGTEETDLKIQLDMTESDKVILPIQQVTLLNPYSDAKDYPTTIQVQKIEEILASKINALLYRPYRKSADLFDLIYTILIQSDYAVDKLEIINTFLRKSVFRRNTPAAEHELLGLPIEEFRPSWSSMAIPAAAALDFNTISEKFSSLVTSLCALVHRITGGGELYLSSADRNRLIKAITDHKLINLMYDGMSREIEPYEIEYYVRKKDNVGSEYFWGYDLSGGNSGTIGIKRFFTSKIASFEETEKTFVPKFIDGQPVEVT